MDRNSMVEQEEVRAEIIGMCVKSINDDKVDMDVELEVDNPNSVKLQLVDIEFVVEDEAQIEYQTKKVHVVQHSRSIHPQTSEIIKVPLKFAYNNVPPASSGTGCAGRIIPFTISARMNFCEQLRGMFQVTINRLKRFLTIFNQKLTLRNFVPPTGFINGAHLSNLSSEEVQINFEARVRNGNPAPIQLLYTDLYLESNGVPLTETPLRMDHNATLGGRTSRRVAIPFKLSLNNMPTAFKLGSVIPYTATVDYWFKENFHGVYKISAQKTGEIPLPIKPVVRVQSASFNMDEQRRPVAKVCLKVQNQNEFPLRVTKLECNIRDGTGTAVWIVPDTNLNKDWDSSAVLEIEGGGGEAGLWMTAASSPGNEALFGSALWDVFSGDSARFHVATVIEADTPQFGRMIF